MSHLKNMAFEPGETKLGPPLKHAGEMFEAGKQNRWGAPLKQSVELFEEGREKRCAACITKMIMEA